VINYSANNRLDFSESGGSRGEAISGPDGKFVIHDRGIGIHVAVSKAGYYQVYEKDGGLASVRTFSNQESLGKSDYPIPPEDAPAVFILRKMGNAVPLIQLARRSVRVAKDGTPTEISLTTGKKTPVGEGDLRVQAWTNDQRPTTERRRPLRLALPHNCP
jgi:hypothetical protein